MQDAIFLAHARQPIYAETPRRQETILPKYEKICAVCYVKKNEAEGTAGRCPIVNIECPMTGSNCHWTNRDFRMNM
jgi:hypothetical protein